jgi:hypothetical protein
MNERAKQLALQALKHPDNDNDGLTVFDNDELEKFAELIVKESFRVALVEGKGYLDPVKLRNAMYKHFGVEE